MNKPVAPVSPGEEPAADAVSGIVEALQSGARRTSTRRRTPSATDGRSARWAEHRATRRDELISAAIVAVRRYGAGAGMDQIAAVAKTSKPVIYRYFDDKDDLYRAITRRVVGTVLDTLVAVLATNPPPRELMHAGIDAYLGLLEDNPELYRFVAQHPLVDDSGDTPGTDFSAVVAGLLATSLERHLGELGLHPAYAHPWSESIVGFINAASLWWLDHRDAMTREQLADYLGSLLWGGAAGVYQHVGRTADAAPATEVFPRRPS
ncbi:MAG TPA: TetR/AcrR family transcriptional regulator [Jatrophihabitantaceae bacterium]|nr:TetR/AcrR family transcriptional regulator [Jatrophihabitantaceae bacterium]